MSKRHQRRQQLRAKRLRRDKHRDWANQEVALEHATNQRFATEKPRGPPPNN